MFLDAGHDAYPYNKNNSLSKSSTPKNSVFNRNNDGTRLMGKALTNITQNSDGTMSFKFKLRTAALAPTRLPSNPATPCSTRPSTSVTTLAATTTYGQT